MHLLLKKKIWLYKRLSYNFIVINKLIIEVIKAKKGLDTLYYIKGLLIINSLNLFKVDFNSIYIYNKLKVLYTFYPKFIFLNIDL